VRFPLLQQVVEGAGLVAVVVGVTWVELSRPKLRAQRAHRMLTGLAIVAVVTAVAIGYCVEGWTLMTSLYFITQIITTVGYGDVTPQTSAMKLWTCFLILVILIVLARELEYLQLFVSSRERDLFGSVVDGRRVRAPRIKICIVSSMGFAGFVLVGTAFYRSVEGCTCSYGATAVRGCDPHEYFTCVATGGEVKTWTDSLYMSIVSLTTVGFGDFSMMSWWGRMFGLPWLICGVACAASFVTSTWQYLSETEKVAGAESTVREYIADLDYDGDGHLSKAEHHVLMLVRSGLVSKELLSALDESFASLDKAGEGRVAFEDLGDIVAASLRFSPSAAQAAQNWDGSSNI